VYHLWLVTEGALEEEALNVTVAVEQPDVLLPELGAGHWAFTVPQSKISAANKGKMMAVVAGYLMFVFKVFI